MDLLIVSRCFENLYSLKSLGIKETEMYAPEKAVRLTCCGACSQQQRDQPRKRDAISHSIHSHREAKQLDPSSTPAHCLATLFSKTLASWLPRIRNENFFFLFPSLFLGLSRLQIPQILFFTILFVPIRSLFNDAILLKYAWDLRIYFYIYLRSYVCIQCNKLYRSECLCIRYARIRGAEIFAIPPNPLNSFRLTNYVCVHISLCIHVPAA